MQSIVLYGIPNCDTVKKARTWLQDKGVDFVFHDFKKNGLERSTVEDWLKHVSLDVLINRKGTTWRALSDEQKASAADTDAAIALMLTSPSIIKRPVLQQADTKSAKAKQVDVGFSAQQYEQLFK
ncbi:ArsC family reductase [Undibacterium terreum]|uniref:Arsenate reductase n=1 Tax=Undibacterium terreum TaxID=1224302 RepID=A0A916XP46_9BURK|nr:ArsC family reductase [Undibacterium terreum]GGC91222.1 arsenate reductase [Undibacterium terreum]